MVNQKLNAYNQNQQDKDQYLSNEIFKNKHKNIIQLQESMIKNWNMMQQELFAEQALFNKHRNMKSSGYLDDEYELTRDFKEVPDYHFRIQNDQQIMELQNLHKTSLPMHAGFVASTSASSSFNSKMDDILSRLDLIQQSSTNKQPYIPPQTHGYYNLDDKAYDQKQSLEAAYQHLQLNSLNKRMENLTINNDKVKEKIKFKNKLKAQNSMSEQREQEAKKQVISKMKRMRIQDQEL